LNCQDWTLNTSIVRQNNPNSSTQQPQTNPEQTFQNNTSGREHLSRQQLENSDTACITAEQQQYGDPSNPVRHFFTNQPMTNRSLINSIVCHSWVAITAAGQMVFGGNG
jgi:hypothetical protein